MTFSAFPPLARACKACQTCFAALAFCLPAALLAQTAAHTNIQRLLTSGQHQQALAEAQAALAQNPSDPQLLFLQANAQSALGQSEAAEQSLVRLSQQYPELPEPYNNLAVIKAAKGELEQARVLLEQAIQHKPDYAQAHENLADVLLRLAAQHLQTAQTLSPAASRAGKLDRLTPLLQTAGN